MKDMNGTDRIIGNPKSASTHVRDPDPETESVEFHGPTSPSVTFLPEGHLIGGRYEVVRPLGRGGFSQVYLANDQELGAEVALKCLRSDRMNREALLRLRRELKVTRASNSPHLVKVFDLGRDGQTVFLSMEPIAGSHLGQLSKRGPLPVPQVLAIGEQILEGLAHLHENGIIHRDLKPSNVLVSSEGTVKITDLGLALSFAAEDTRLTRESVLMGTAEYMSPEQALGQELGPATDLYSFGVLLFEILTGRLPFERSTSVGTLLKRLQSPAPDIRLQVPDLPPWLSRLTANLLEREPQNRPCSVESVLQQWRNRRVAPKRATRRKRLTAYSLTAALLALALGLGFIFQEVRATRFSHLVDDHDWVSGISKNGKTLWRLEGLGRTFVPVRYPPKGEPKIVGFLRHSASADPVSIRTLTVINAQTGEIESEKQLPGLEYPRIEERFSNRYGAYLSTVDIDGDSLDEIIIDYMHNTEWPSYSLLYQPLEDRVQRLMVASGHHYFVDAHDFDGDGRQELIYVGINNRMGWLRGIGVVRPLPDDPTRGPGAVVFPGDSYSPFHGQRLLWYSLMPSDACLNSTCLTFDDRRGLLSVDRVAGPPWQLSYAGFPFNDPSEATVENRSLARERAYWGLFDADRLFNSGKRTEALEGSQEAYDLANQAGDPLLIHWARRRYATFLVAAGRVQEGLALFQSSDHSTLDPKGYAFDVGQAFFLAGRFEEAMQWYLKGLLDGANHSLGRHKYQYLIGVILAADRLGQWDRARLALAGYESAYPDIDSQNFRQYIDWRSGLAPKPIQIIRAAPDELRYWDLEMRVAAGESTDSLLAALRTEREQAFGVPRYLTEMLESSVRASMGQGDPAWALAKSSYLNYRKWIGLDIFSVAQWRPMQDRLLKVAELGGHLEEAKLLLESNGEAPAGMSWGEEAP